MFSPILLLVTLVASLQLRTEVSGPYNSCKIKSCVFDETLEKCMAVRKNSTCENTTCPERTLDWKLACPSWMKESVSCTDECNSDGFSSMEGQRFEYVCKKTVYTPSLKKTTYSDAACAATKPEDLALTCLCSPIKPMTEESNDMPMTPRV
jgi:hypothetical protein